MDAIPDRSARLTLQRFFAAVIAISGVVLVTFWGLYFAEDSMRAQVRDRIRAVPVPPLINGLQLSFEGVEAVASKRTNDGKDIRRVLLLVTSDDCRFCTQIQGRWMELLRTIPIDAHDEVIIASFRGQNYPERLGQVLQQRGVSFRRLAIQQQAVFGASTGISSTPTTAILDADSRLRYATNVLDERSERLLMETWSKLVSD